MLKFFSTLLFLLTPALAIASGGGQSIHMEFVYSIYGYIALGLFVVAYTVVIFEEKIHLRKSKPVILVAGVIWILVALAYISIGEMEHAHHAIKHNFVEYAELFLFLLVAMTYINSMEERNVFQSLRAWLVTQGFSLRKVFWVTGVLSFFISPLADNLTTALLMGAVVMAIGRENTKFIALACINIVVAANAGGAFSPFGDITTLMVWQKGQVEFTQFFRIFVPSVFNWLVPAVIMHFAISDEQPEPLDEEISLKFGAHRIILLFLATIATAVSFHNFLHLPPASGMMLGLGYLGLFSFYIKHVEHRSCELDSPLGMCESEDVVQLFDLFKRIAKAEWDTLLFFYGVILCVGGLAQFGYLAMVSSYMYTGMGPTFANVMVGILSAIVDNIPVMFAVLTMDPHMSLGQWLLVTLTAGVGGSLLSIGSAAGVALMGTARNIYTFSAHLKWTLVIALGYAASIIIHLLINASIM
ncbi:MAG: NhaD-like Na+/H+ antiporter [Candidatus Magnetoglobus multicellularis str. Araruama]|uniref:NhaD-like Na+/H+ antiporter n=1 Tax=Candidatus Magnetoglobus multicellularis str. Araruama TaxID=890399 RepID=A0A1V1P8I8_9BACT|nr:MAG: NhaD-like Na+/H+ antiporter [Candidatus Magnetoglobus multicellularis str. Araruama]